MITIIIDNSVLEKYYEHYFSIHPRAKKKPIRSPIPPSLNQWMVLPRLSMNNEKQKWKDFGIFIVKHYGYENMKITKCNIEITYYFPTKHRRDASNYSNKFLEDGFVEAGLLVDDSFDCIESLLIKAGYDKDNPRMEIRITGENI